MTSIIKAKNYAFRRSVNKPLEVLIESEKDGVYVGLDQYFNKIAVKSSHDLKGEWITFETFEAEEEINFAKL